MAGQYSARYAAATTEVFGADFVRLQHIMPEGIWKLVCDKLLQVGPSHLENLANSSPFFRKLQMHQRTTHLFEKVFPLVTAKIWKTEGIDGLPVTEVLNYRAVCSQWNDAIDRLIPSEFQNFEGGSQNCTNLAEVSDEFKPSIEFTNFVMRRPKLKKSVHKFLQYFENTHPGNKLSGRNPFIWEDISVRVCNEGLVPEIENYQQFLQGISTLLLKYGRHIRGFTLRIYSNQFFENVSCFQEWLLCMPNLKKLSFINNSKDDELEIEVDLDQYLEDNPFPKLSQLEEIHIEKLPVQMIDPLICQNNHVTKLTIKSDDDFDVFTFPMPNLKELSMNLCPLNIADKLASPNVQWPLETLELEMENTDDCEALAQVIRKKFSNSLVSLSLEFTEFRNVRDSDFQEFQSIQPDMLKLINISVNRNATKWCLLPMKK